jgi:alcohol dehydrogenase class IV
MNGLQHIAYRTYQKVLWLVSHFLPFREPQLLKGPGSIVKLPELLASKKMNRVLIVTDKGLMRLHLLDSLFSAFQQHQIIYEVFDEVVPNPTIENIEQALLRFHAIKADAIVAFGGGSPMDVAKAVGARVARPSKQIPDLKGILKVGKPIPPLFAVPTTAGTGSEATVAAVVTNAATHEKYAINDPVLIPQ